MTFLVGVRGGFRVPLRVPPIASGLVENGKKDGLALLGDEMERLWRRGDSR